MCVRQGVRGLRGGARRANCAAGGVASEGWHAIAGFRLDYLVCSSKACEADGLCMSQGWLSGRE